MREDLFKGSINGIPLIKFQKKDIIDKTVQGSIYMNSLKYYREEYNKSLDEEIGDPCEGMLYINEGHMIVYNENSKDITEVKQLQNTIIHTVNSDDYVFCMFGINPKFCHSFRFSDEQKKKWLEIYDTALLITDSEDFFKRIAIASQNEGLELSGGFVNYYNEQSGDISPWISSVINGTNSVAYYKRMRYAYQQEFRIIAPSGKKDNLEIDIGNISGISEVFSLEVFLNSEFTPH